MKLDYTENSDGSLIIGSKSTVQFFKDITEQRLKALEQNQEILLEMVDWSTYVRPGEPGFIVGEMMEATVSGNGKDYTIEEVLPAVNTMIGKPIKKVPGAYKGQSYVKNPENLHADPKKKDIGETQLVRFKNNRINFLGRVDTETYTEMKNGLWPHGSIEGQAAFAKPSNKAIAEVAPEFIQFKGYLLLPKWATPGIGTTNNQIYEQLQSKWCITCPGKMTKPASKVNFFRS